MNQIKPIVQQNQRVLTTSQLANSYGTTAKRISNNFSENFDRFQAQKHFICLTGNDLEAFKNDSRNSGLVQKQASKLYLWTEKGAWLHAKSLNTDQAWDAYEALVDDYYRKADQLNQLVMSQLSPQVQAMINIEIRQNQLEQELAATSSQVKDLQQGLVDINKPLRKQFNDAVRDYVKAAGIGFDDAYRKVYDVLSSQHNVDIKRRVENRKAKGQNLRPIDIVEELNLLVPAVRLAKVLAATS